MKMFGKLQLKLLLWLVSMKACFAMYRYDESYSACSETLPESQRLKRNCPPLMPMLLHHLKSAVCNDGSPAGYYFRRGGNSKDWVVFLEGGGYCFNKWTCSKRSLLSKSRKYSLLSIEGSSKKKFVTGILSTQRKTNPIWWNANHVYIPYCSSDIWIGNRSASRKGTFSFHGARIVDEVLDDLWQKRGLNEAKNLTLAGSSAGGTGVMLNIDRVARDLKARNANIHVQGIVDSGWFLGSHSVRSLGCSRPKHNYKQSHVIRTALRYWNADLPLDCTKGKSLNNQYLCLFGDNLYPTIKSPIFVIQWIYDLAQIGEDNPELLESLLPLINNSTEYSQYLHCLEQRVRLSLKSVRSFFAPSCLGHTIITREKWLETRVSMSTLSNALKCWLNGDALCQYNDACKFPSFGKHCPRFLEMHTSDITTIKKTENFQFSAGDK